MTSSTKPEVHSMLIMLPEHDRDNATGPGNRHRKLGEFWSCDYDICVPESSNRQTRKETGSSEYNRA